MQKNIDMLDKGISIDDKEEEKTYAQSTLENSQEGSEGEGKFLGVLWSVVSDEIVLDFSNMCPSKRKLTLQVKSYYWDN